MHPPDFNLPMPVLPISKGDQIKAARKRLDMSQAELASRLGVAQSTVARWESGATPSEELHDALTEVLGVKFDRTNASSWVETVREDREIPFYVRALMLEIRARAASDVALVIMGAYEEEGVSADDLNNAIELGVERGLWKIEDNQGDVVLLRFATH